MSEQGSPHLNARLGSVSPRGASTRDWEELSSALLEDGFILTALELHTELLEAGKDVPSLRDYFSNPGNFESALPQLPSSGLLHSMVRASSHSTLDSMEFGRYSDDLDKENNDRVAVLEFELRKALETIKSLRGSLTKATEIGPSKEGESSSRVKAKSDDPIMPHEKRALNFLTNEYLMQQNNKLTAITFSEENGDQDFEDWDDVGLNIPQPPDLLCLFRNYTTAMLSDKEKLDRIQALEDQVATLTGENLAVKRENEALINKQKKPSVSSLPESSGPRRGGSHGDFSPPTRIKSSPQLPAPVLDSRSSEQLERVSESPSEKQGSKDEELSMSTNSAVSVKSDATLESSEPVRFQHSPTPEEPSLVENDGATPTRQTEGSGHRMSVQFRQELLGVCQAKTDSVVGMEISKVADSETDMVQLLGRSLPEIVPHVALNKREETIPVLLLVLAKHPDTKVRYKLVQLMFNLMKRPDRGQRSAIMSGCVAFAKFSNVEHRVENELLPQLWGQITEKHYERRLLVAESCGVLAPYIPAELRGSLVLSMLKQMLSEDPAESVRQAVTRSLGVIVAFTDDEEKFNSCWELLLKAITDRSQLVVSTAYSVLLPALAAWAFELGTMEKNMLSYFLHQLLTCVKQVSRSEGDSGAVEQSHHHTLTLTHLIPWHMATILLSGPYLQDLPQQQEPRDNVNFPKPSSPLLDIEVIVGDRERLSSLVAAFEDIVRGTFTPWSSLEWFQNEFLNKLVRVLVALGFNQLELLHRLSILLSSYCLYLGHVYTHSVIKPFFEVCLKLPNQNAGSALAEGHTKITTPVLAVYVAGVLATFPQDEKLLSSYLRTTVVDMALYFAPIDSLKTALTELKSERKSHPLLFAVLGELATHSSFQVRRYVATLYGVMVRGVDEALVMRTVVPQLTKLARDTEISVVVDTVPSFGIIMETVTSKDILVRVHEQFELFVSADQSNIDHQLLMAVLQTLARIGPRADPVFRDEFIIPRLASISAVNNQTTNLTKQRDVTEALLEAYRSIAGCFISVDLLTSCLLPGLECLEVDVEKLCPEKTPIIVELLASCNSKISDYQKQDQPSESSATDSRASAFFSKLKPSFDRSDLAISPSKFFKRKQ